MKSSYRSVRSEWPLLLLLTCIIAGLGAHGAQIGWSSHGDSRAIIEGSVPAILHGSYQPSRSLGNPLYEAICALLYWMTGSFLAVNLYSLVLAIAALFVFAMLLDPALGRTRGSLVLIGFALNPLILINSSTLIEWMQVTFFLLILLTCAKSWLVNRRRFDLVGYGVSSGLLVLTRPDMVVMCAALLLALFWEVGFSKKFIGQLLVTNIVAGIFTATIFVVINHGVDFLDMRTAGYLGNDPPLRRFGIAILSMINLFGPLGIIVIAMFALDLARRALLHDRGELSWWGRLFVVAAPIFLVRFIILSEKLEFLLPLVIVTLLAVAHQRLATLWVAIISISLIIPSAVSLSLFKRTEDKDRLALKIGLNRGALAQDWELTSYNKLVTTPQFLEKIANIVYEQEPPPRPTVRSVNYLFGLVSDRNDLIIGRDELYRLDNERFPDPSKRRESYRQVYVCDKSMAALKPGWRALQEPLNLPVMDPTTDRLVLHCRREGQ